MLRIVIAEEAFDDEKEEFVLLDPVVVDLEHSLVSLSKWESKFQRPFLDSGEKTPEEIFAYIEAMVVTPGIGPDVLVRCSQEHLDKIQEYISSSQSATTFGTMPEHRGRGERITSELIYYWMVAYTIPWEAQYWHLNRLFSLIRICNLKNSNQKERKLTRNDIEERRRLNEQRRAALGTTG